VAEINVTADIAAMQAKERPRCPYACLSNDFNPYLLKILFEIFEKRCAAKKWIPGISDASNKF
jgi:hypothetical protein